MVWPSLDKDAFSAGSHATYRRIRPHIPASTSNDGVVVLKNSKNLLPRPLGQAYPKVSVATKKKKAAAASAKKRKREVSDPAGNDANNMEIVPNVAAPRNTTSNNNNNRQQETGAQGRR